jgi:hypothetical protein
MAGATPVTLVQPKLWESAIDYWSMQIAAILLYLHEHKNLSTRPDNLIGREWENWSLNDFAGWVGAAGLASMKAHIQAWGAQYLLADYCIASVESGRTLRLG